MNRRLQAVERDATKATSPPAGNGKLSRAEKLSLLCEIERIANSQHVALMQKIQRLREAIASDN
jgi:hypothetical protein